MTENNRVENYAVVFDLGNVLIEWNPRFLYRKLFDNHDEMESFLARVCTHEWNLQLDGGRPFAEAIAELIERFPEHHELISAYHSRWEEMVPGVIDESVKLLAELKHAGYPIYALSNWASETFARVRARFELLNWFELIIISGEVKLVKPDARIYQLLLEKIARPAHETIFIDDSLVNVAAAAKLGLHTIHFQSPAQLRAELQKLGIEL